MITLKQWMELINYKITDGGDYNLLGEKLYSLTSWSGTNDGYSIEIIFKQDTQTVYIVEACDYKNNRAYRLINPVYADLDHDKTAWDETKWIDLDVDADFVEKAQAIVAGKDYDTSVMVELDLPDDLLLKTALAAHRDGITLNDYINRVLAEFCNEIKTRETAQENFAKALHDI